MRQYPMLVILDAGTAGSPEYIYMNQSRDLIEWMNS
jgi:hypothetical protein